MNVCCFTSAIKLEQRREYYKVQREIFKEKQHIKQEFNSKSTKNSPHKYVFFSTQVHYKCFSVNRFISLKQVI